MPSRGLDNSSKPLDLSKNTSNLNLKFSGLSSLCLIIVRNFPKMSLVKFINIFQIKFFVQSFRVRFGLLKHQALVKLSYNTNLVAKELVPMNVLREKFWNVTKTSNFISNL